MWNAYAFHAIGLKYLITFSGPSAILKNLCQITNPPLLTRINALNDEDTQLRKYIENVHKDRPTDILLSEYYSERDIEI